LLTVGIIGYGVLGQAMHKALRGTYEVKLIDPPKGLNQATLDECDKYILCAPTPSNEDGSCDASIVTHYVETLSKPLLVKSTVDPTIICKLHGDHPLTYSPEFLRESSSYEDFINQDFAIFSGDDPAGWADFMSESGVNMKKVAYTTVEAAAYAKYAINTFLATKVIFFNELHKHIDNNKMCDSDTYENMIQLISMDDRIGNSHMQVPGPDGKLGYGGMCFPKDVKALVFNRDLNILQTVIKVNEELR